MLYVGGWVRNWTMDSVTNSGTVAIPPIRFVVHKMTLECFLPQVENMWECKICIVEIVDCMWKGCNQPFCLSQMVCHAHLLRQSGRGATYDHMR